MNNANTSHTEYEPTARVCTVFFSVVLGFGLNHILHADKTLKIAADSGPCFVLAFLLFLRFLFGSANFLWSELIRPRAAPPSLRGIVWDTLCLVGFALIAVWICDSNDTPQFLLRNLIFGGVAVFISIVNVFVRGDLARDFALPWLVINLLQVAAVGALLKWGYPLACLMVIYLVFLLADVFFQLWGVRKAMQTIRAKPVEDCREQS